MNVEHWHFHDAIYLNSIILLRSPGKHAEDWLLESFKGYVGDMGNWGGGKALWLDGHKGTALVLWFPEKFAPKTEIELSTLTHECFHGTEMTLRNRGLSLSNGSHEAYAYHIGWLFRECYKRLVVKHVRKGKKR